MIIVAAAVPFGFRFHVGGAVLGLVILAVFCVGLGSLSYSLALVARNQDWVFWSVQQTLLFPLLLLAGILLPIDGGPRQLPTAAQFNPLTYVVDAQRALFNGELIGSTVAGGAVAAGAVTVIGLFVGVRVMRRSS